MENTFETELNTAPEINEAESEITEGTTAAFEEETFDEELTEEETENMEEDEDVAGEIAEEANEQIEEELSTGDMTEEG